MEGKRVAAAAAALYLLIMLSCQQQVAGLTEFCGCFGDCYPGCREGHPRWFCTIQCVESCTVDVAASGVVAVAGAGAGDCSRICLASICGAAEETGGPSGAGGAAACVGDCTENWKRFKNKHTWVDKQWWFVNLPMNNEVSPDTDRMIQCS